ncbi:MAG: cbb3-type cytochrome c oxidase subunit I [Rickettsia endosymbiont of Bryobia graminum]|nr:cbb3-type cytochrome c oxidase subunit I [Rickettsia endosymbiont of Bryobia graminum]
MNSENNIISYLRNNQLASYWLKNGITALALAGIYSIILVFLRTPLLSSLFSNTEIFKSSLVIHVNLSILVWLLSVTAAIWSYAAPTSNYNFTFVILAFLGTVLIALAPLCGQNFPVMNNYIPMLENIIFILGISLFGIAVLLFACLRLYYIYFNKSNNYSDKLINITIASTTTLYILVWLCFLLSYLQLQVVINFTPIGIEYFYELLFWSGGHLLQFIYTQILTLIWIILFSQWLDREVKFSKVFFILLNLNFIIAIIAIFGHFYDITSNEFREYYTKQMRYGGSIAPVAILIVMLWEKISKNNTSDSYAIVNYRSNISLTTLICSILLFLFGGFIGLLIKGMNVTIPAHYHGSIVGISIAFMGFSFLPYYNQKEKTYFSLVIIILTIGQILHITGLLFAGGYGALRKTPGLEMEFSAKLLMGVMGFGGLIAIVGGLMFVVICGRKIFFKRVN